MHSDYHSRNKLNKFILNQCSKEEADEVITLIQNMKGPDQLPTVEDVLKLLDKKPTMTLVDANRIHDNIINIVKQKENKRKRFYVWKYSVAATIAGILAITYVLRDDLFNNPIDKEQTIVKTNAIQTGTDKATLTLKDGSVVALEKGTSYQTQNIKSNGEEIVYGVGDKNSSEIAYNYLTIPRGGQFFIKLSDGTQVWLNSESQLKYPVTFREGETREVELVYGEAYFDVSPSTDHDGSHFKVMNSGQEVEVLGTEFNIKAYKDETNIYTTLVEGKVSVNNNFENKILSPNQQSTISNNSNAIVIAKVDVKNETSWKRGFFSFKNKPLNEIMRVLSRWYDFDVVFLNKDLENIEFKGVLSKKQNIEEILLSLKNINVINNYEISNKTITIK
ncbi:FecR family protein [Flavivirga sp. 57AJ16]|uniref:FecR family protein n=1 Tax=Flavivirga sp. 57AJ16 TaxID=3025307 RepID=UPI0023667BED|nr:FecR family protein [Flavivirga sp. 57AJ16]MDD7885085.1 FecR domain-containing protein [Flavivirga sp. 57AJ16]